MFCRQCGHNNPEANRFCGMCGGAMAVVRQTDDPHLPTAGRYGAPMEPEHAVKKSPVTDNSRATEVRVERPAEIRRTPVEVREPELVAAEPVKHGDQRLADSGEITIGGPSFLGLSSKESGDGEYSYLFQEEEEPSHKAGWVLLVLLLVLGGVLYARWQPIRDYALTAAISHSRPQQTPPANNAAPPGPESRATPAESTPAPVATVPSSNAQTPPITTENSADQKKAAESKMDESKQVLAERDKEPAENSSVGAKAVDKQAEQQQAAVKEETPPDKEKPAAAKSGGAAQVSEGGELVSSGEKYLYGRGVARSCGHAVRYFNAAAAKQNLQAFSHLGALYATGQCVPKDRAVAYAWFRRAYVKEPGNRYIEQNLTMLWREMTPAERQRATGRQ